MPLPTRAAFGAGVLGSLLAVAACGESRAGRTYFDREIEPILLRNCSGNTSGCHAADPADPYQFAAGNLDVTSFENIQKRKDLLRPFGPYQTPPLLIKAVDSQGLSFAYNDEFHDLEILHGGGANLEVGSDAYLTLLTWLENGATENGVAPPTPPRDGEGGCSAALPSGFDPSTYLANPNFAGFRDTVQPVLESCSAANCHGAPQSDFYLSCGDDDAQLAFNFSQAWAFVDDPVDESQILRVPLAVGSGGGPHTGGDQLTSRDSADYLAIRAWAELVGPLEFGAGDAGKTFFAANVQPILIKRGCGMPACHSPAASNDLKLRAGSDGFFSAVSLQRNYDLVRDEFMALEFPDARRGRAVAKTIDPRYGGIDHRARAVLETIGAGGSIPANCPAVYDPLTASAFCTVQEWVDIERGALISANQVDPMTPGSTLPIVYVERAATHVASPLQFDTYQPGSDLLVASATLGADQVITGVGGGTSLLAGCPGAGNLAQVDVRSPDVRHDGTTVTFAMRTSASDPLGVYTVNINGTGCQRVTPAAPDVSGIKIHNFDPSWSPDGEWIVFASTRGASGPSVSRQLFLPQSDIWRMHRDGSAAEQMTFLTNSEIQPQMMREGRVTMTTEKVSAGFYQLAGRRINWDRTDYHPLLGQRATSLYATPEDLASTLPSIDYAQATEIRESSDGNFSLILSDRGARGGAGTLAQFNRSIGPFEAGRVDPGYLPSVTIIDPAATGRVGSATSGAYRSPYGLPDGKLMVSYAAFNGDLGTATTIDWDIVAIDRDTGTRTTLIGGAGAQVEAVLAVKHPARKPYLNRRQLVFGGAIDPSLGDHAVVHFPDAPMVFTLLTANLRRGRPVEAFRAATQLAIYGEGAAPPGTSSGGGPGGIFESRQLLGRAPLASDGSAKIRVPAGVGVILELQNASGTALVTMGEEHQLAPGETISLGIPEPFFDAVCGGCHGSVTGSELDVAITPDALTGASQSLSAAAAATPIGP